MGIRNRSPGKYYVQPFGVEGRSWPFTAMEIARAVRYVAVSCIVVFVVSAEMFAFLTPGSTAAGLFPFFAFVLLLIPTLHLVSRFLRPPHTEIARRWEHILSHPDDYPYEPRTMA